MKSDHHKTREFGSHLDQEDFIEANGVKGKSAEGFHTLA